MIDNLRNKTKIGFLWSTIERLSTQGVQFIFGIILARILSPTDYGIIAMPVVFLNIAQVFIDSGFSNALIRKQNLNEKDLSTAFYFNIMVGLVCYAVLFVCSPLIASFYKTPILEQLLRVTALTILLNPLCAVHQALVTIRLDFKIQARISFVAAIVSGIIGVIMAYSGFGVWSLVVQQVLTCFIRTSLMWSMIKWKPALQWSRESFKYLWGFGNKMMLSSLINTLYQNVYPLIIGRFYMAGQLGFYTRAYQFSQLPSSNFTGIIKRVSYPVLSSLQSNDQELSLKFRKTLRASVFIICPIMFGLFAASDPLICVVLTDKWLSASLLLKILCLAMVWYPIDALNLNLLMIKGRSDLFLKLEVIKKIFGFAILFVGVKYGFLALCSTAVFYSLFEIITDTYYTGKYFNLGLKKQLHDIAPSFVISTLMAVILLCLNLFVKNSLLALTLDCIFGPLIYIGMYKVLGIKDLDEIILFLKK